MKLNGIFGTGSGKVGASVWAVSSGVQIVRPYQPNVSNPNTDAQVAQRAKFKLISQVAAALASIIAFKKQNLVSARNQFVSANIGLVTFENGQAEIDLKGLTLTGSSVNLPTLLVNAQSDTTQEVKLSSGAAEDVDAVLYASIHETEDKKIEIVDVKISNSPGASRDFAATINNVGGNEAIYAYGIKFANDAARQRYDDYVADVANDVATLDIVSNAILSGASFTRTRYEQL